MPQLTSEISAGQQFQFSSKDGQIAASQTRKFKVLLTSPGEVFDIQSTCGVFIGDVHPYNSGIYCTNYEAQYDGDSRMVVICSFSYESTASATQQDPKQFNPEIRPANWSTSSSLAEVRAYTWERVNGISGSPGTPTPVQNVVGDIYDGVVKQEAVVSITIDQFEPSDPTRHCLLAGSTNSVPFTVGSLQCGMRTVMFRGVQARPVVEQWRGYLYRGWMATYEFVYRRNYVRGWHGIDEALGSTFTYNSEVGWDIVVPLTGFNVKAFNPLDPDPNDDVYGQPLKHESGKITDTLALPNKVTAGSRVRAMLPVYSYEEGGTSQVPSAQPIPLNPTGRPRKESASPKVIMLRYKVTEEIDFKPSFGLRLY